MNEAGVLITDEKDKLEYLNSLGNDDAVYAIFESLGGVPIDPPQVLISGGFFDRMSEDQAADLYNIF